MCENIMAVGCVCRVNLGICTHVCAVLLERTMVGKKESNDDNGRG